jgi:hypothetical protein
MELWRPAAVLLAIMSFTRSNPVPVILWLLGVPLSLVLILMLAGVVHF